MSTIITTLLSETRKHLIGQYQHDLLNCGIQEENYRHPSMILHLKINCVAFMYFLITFKDIQSLIITRKSCWHKHFWSQLEGPGLEGGMEACFFEQNSPFI